MKKRRGLAAIAAALMCLSAIIPAYADEIETRSPSAEMTDESEPINEMTVIAVEDSNEDISDNNDTDESSISESREDTEVGNISESTDEGTNGAVGTEQEDVVSAEDDKAETDHTIETVDLENADDKADSDPIIDEESEDDTDNTESDNATTETADINDSDTDEAEGDDTELEEDSTEFNDSSYSDFSYVVNSNGGITITKYNGAGGNVVIPDTIESKKVTEIGKEAFFNATSVSSVSFPKDVRTIGKQAFFHTGITSLSLPNSVTTINEDAFARCENLASIALSSNLTSIGSGAFCDCDKLTTVVIPASVTTAYRGSGKYYSVYDNYEEIYLSTSNYVGPFSHCDDLKSITFSEASVQVASNLFYDCDNIESITIPSQVKTIGEYAFYDCDDLGEITIRSSTGAATIQKDAFSHCEKLRSVSFGSAIRNIETYAFCDDIALTDITWGGDERTIGKQAFFHTGITSLSLPNSVTTINEDAFARCENLASIALSSNLTSIGSGAFCDCDKLTTVVIPASVTTAYRGSGKYYSVYDNYEEIYLSTSNYVGPFSHCDNLIVVLFAKGSAQVAPYLLYDCDHITDVALPATVTKIETQAFYGCDKVKRVSIPCEAKNISTDAFNGCTLEHVHLPKDATVSDYVGKCGLPSETSKFIKVKEDGKCGASNCPLNAVPMIIHQENDGVITGTFEGTLDIDHDCELRNVYADIINITNGTVKLNNVNADQIYIHKYGDSSNNFSTSVDFYSNVTVHDKIEIHSGYAEINSATCNHLIVKEDDNQLCWVTINRLKVKNDVSIGNKKKPGAGVTIGGKMDVVGNVSIYDDSYITLDSSSARLSVQNYFTIASNATSELTAGTLWVGADFTQKTKSENLKFGSDFSLIFFGREGRNKMTLKDPKKVSFGNLYIDTGKKSAQLEAKGKEYYSNFVDSGSMNGLNKSNFQGKVAAITSGNGGDYQINRYSYIELRSSDPVGEKKQEIESDMVTCFGQLISSYSASYKTVSPELKKILNDPDEQLKWILAELAIYEGLMGSQIVDKNISFDRLELSSGERSFVLKVDTVQGDMDMIITIENIMSLKYNGKNIADFKTARWDIPSFNGNNNGYLSINTKGNVPEYLRQAQSVLTEEAINELEQLVKDYPGGLFDTGFFGSDDKIFGKSAKELVYKMGPDRKNHEGLTALQDFYREFHDRLEKAGKLVTYGKNGKIDKFYSNAYSIFSVECPVDVYVYGPDDKMAVSIEHSSQNENGYAITNNDPSIMVLIDDHKKYIYIYNDEKYSFKYVGYDIGTMQHYVYSGENDELTEYSPVKLENGRVYTETVIMDNNDTIKETILTDVKNGTRIPPKNNNTSDEVVPAKPTTIIKTAFGGRTVQLNCADADAEIYYQFGSSNITSACKHVKAGETIFLNEPMTGNKAAMYFKAYKNGKWSALGKWGVLNVQIAKPLISQSGKASENKFKVYTQTKNSYIIYTLDGSKPAIEEGNQKLTVKNGKIVWGTTATITVPKGKTIKAIAVRCGLVTSDVMTYTNK